MKKLLALLLSTVLTFSLVACSSGTKTESENEAVTIRILAASSSELEANIVRDQLIKAGFNAVTELAPSLSARIDIQKTGNYDVVFGGWTTVTGNPDYAVRSLYHSASDPTTGINDPYIDELIDLGATQTSEEYVETYAELERYMIEEKAYVVPLYSTMKLNVYNNTVLDSDYINLPKASSQLWHTYSYVDASLNDTRPMNRALANSGVMTHLDPIQANDSSVGDINQNTHIRLLSLDTEDQPTTDYSLSLNFAIAEGNQDYYFVLRDDVNFAKIEDGVPVDTGVRVGAEDVIFTLTRAADMYSVPSNAVDALFAYIETLEVVTDLEELNTVLDSTTGAPVFETLAEGLDNDLTTLVADKTEVDNTSGSYQVVKLHTKEAFPQILNMVAHVGGGIVSEEQVSSMNDLIDSSDEWANYDVTSDVVYGDFNAVKSGDMHLWTSGPYALTEITDLEATLMKNPGYMTSEEEPVLIDDVTVKFFKDNTSALNEFRSGGLDYLAAFDSAQYDILAEEPTFTILQRSSNSVSTCTFNLDAETGTIFTDENLRLAVLYALDPNTFIAVKNNLVEPAYSTVSPLIGNPNSYEQDLELSAQYLQAYYDSLAAE